VQRLQHRWDRVAGRRVQRRADHLEVVVHQVDVADRQPVEHGGHVRVRDPHHRVVRAGDIRELPVREHAEHLVGLDRAVPDGGQDDPVAAGAQLRDQRGDDVLDAAVVGRRHRQPRAGVDEHGQRGGRHLP